MKAHDRDRLEPRARRPARLALNQIGVLVLHISREVIHHGSELSLMRDLYRTTAAGSKAVGETAGVRS